MPVRRKICTIEEFTEIKLRLADFFDRLVARTADDALAVEPDGAKWWAYHYRDPRSGRSLTDFGFSYVADMLRNPADEKGWQLSPPKKERGETEFCWIHKHKYPDEDENLYTKISIIEFPFKDDPEAEFLVLLWSCHGNKDEVEGDENDDPQSDEDDVLEFNVEN